MTRPPFSTSFRFQCFLDTAEWKRNLALARLRSAEEPGCDPNTVPERISSFERLCLSKRSKESLWRICRHNRSIYRPSTILMLILSSYVKALQKSHVDNKVHRWNKLQSNIGFRDNNYGKIFFYIPPVKCVKKDFENQKRKDYADLAAMIENLKVHFELDEFPVELKDFLAMLKDPIGREHLIGNHFAFWDFSKRKKFLLRVITKTKVQAFKAKLRRALDCKILKERLEGCAPFTGDDVLWKDFRIALTGSFLELIESIGNLLAHVQWNKKGELQTLSEVEWRIYEAVPFYMELLCTELAKINLYPRLSVN